MPPGDLPPTPNPFATFSARAARSPRGTPVPTRTVSRRPGSAKRPFWAASKLLLCVLVGLAAVAVIGDLSRAWLLGRWTQDFDQLAADARRDRVVQIAELGEPAIEFLVLAMGDPDIGVARAAYESLRQMQAEWAASPTGAMTRRQRSLVSAVDSQGIQITDDRTGWASNLVRRAMMDTDGAQEAAGRELHRLAADTLSRLSLAERPGPSVLESAGDDAMPTRIAARVTPLPVALLDPQTENADPGAAGPGADGLSGWADGGTGLRPMGPAPNEGWQPLRDADEDPARIRAGRPPDRESPGQTQTPGQNQTPGQTRAAGQEGAAGQAESQAMIDAAFSPASLTGDAPTENRLVTSPMQTLDDRSVVHWLRDADPRRRHEARQELRGRGWSAEEIEVAVAVVSPDLATRLAMVDTIARSDRLDPRPWLLWLLEDTSRDVKLRALSVLGTLGDPEVTLRLRSRLAEERDPTVAAAIRRATERR